MSIPTNVNDLEIKKFVEYGTAGTVAVRVSNPDGSPIGGGGSGTSSTYVQGAAANGTTNLGNPVKIGIAYNGTAPTATSGQVGDAQGDVNYNLKVTQATGEAGEDTTNYVTGMIFKPVASSTYSPLDFTSFGGAAGTGVAVKGSAGNIYSAYITNGGTSLRYFHIFNSVTAPANGGTPVASYILGAGSTANPTEKFLDYTHFAPSKYNSTGIAIAISSTNGTLGTASIVAADHNIILKYF